MGRSSVPGVIFRLLGEVYAAVERFGNLYLMSLSLSVSLSEMERLVRRDPGRGFLSDVFVMVFDSVVLVFFVHPAKEVV